MDNGRAHRGDASSPRKITIRARQSDDIATCVRVLAAVHEADGYPVHWPADPPAWLTPDNLLAA